MAVAVVTRVMHRICEYQASEAKRCSPFARFTPALAGMAVGQLSGFGYAYHHGQASIGL